MYISLIIFISYLPYSSNLVYNALLIVSVDESGSFTVIVDGFDGDAIEAAAALLYRGEINVGPGTDSGALATAFTELIVPDRKVNYCIGSFDLLIFIESTAFTLSKGSVDLVGPVGANEDKENDEETTSDERRDFTKAIHKCDQCENRTFR